MSMKTDMSPAFKAWSQRARRFHALDFTKHWAWVIARMILIMGMCFVILYPLFFKVSISFKDKLDIYDSTVLWIPKHFTLDTLRIAYEAMDYGKSFTNSVIVAVLSTVLQAASCALAAFGFARLPFKGSGLLFAGVILTILVPVQTIMIPTYVNYRYFDVFGLIGLFTGQNGLNLLDSYWPFVLQSITGMGIQSGLFIYIFRQFFRGIPKELEEAAYIDGCGVLQGFSRVMLPNAVPAIITVMLFSFVWQWNDNYYVSLFLTRADVLSAKLSIAWASFSLEDPLFAYMIKNAGELLFIAPVILMYLFVQRYFIESVERTGIVG